MSTASTSYKKSHNNMQNTLVTATGLSYGSGLASFITGLTLNEWLAGLGAFFMVLTYFTNLFFRMRDDKRKQIELSLKTQKWRRGDDES